MFLKWGEGGQSAQKETQCRNCRGGGEMILSLPEEVQEVNSTAKWESRYEKGRNWTGSRAAGGR